MRNLFGTTPQIDLDHSMVRTRIAKPVTFDFASLADQVKRTNVTTLAVHLEAAAEVRDGQVVLQPTGQAFPLEGRLLGDPGAARRRLKVHGWEGGSARLEVVR
ncbi:MAG TPA: hypothetical protein VGK61_08865 [Planctomycetota bacterium]|jgi:hypothetical protein